MKNKRGAVTWVVMLLFTGALVACSRDGGQADLSTVTSESLRAAPKQFVRVDPRLCPGGGDGYVYFALGEMVVRLDPNKIVDPVRGISVGNGFFLIPQPSLMGQQGLIAREFDPGVLESMPFDPESPEGCYGHPIRVQHLILTDYQDEILGKRGGTFGERPLRSIRVYRHPRANVRSYGESLLYTNGQNIPCVPAGGGVLECTERKTSATTPTILTFPIDTYSAPQGRKFVALCGFGPGIQNDQCKVEYWLAKDVVAQYEFERGKVVAPRLMSFDRSLREGMAKIAVRAYPWKGFGGK